MALTFRELLTQTLNAVTQGQYTAAAQGFQQLENEFGNEPEYANPENLRKILPVKALAQWQAGWTQEALASFQSIATDFPELLDKHPELLFSYAQALRKTGQYADAMKRFERYERINPGSTEALIARMRRAEAAFKLEQFDEGIELLDELYQSGAPDTFRFQGRLMALQTCLANQRLEQALDLLLDTDWAVSTMPELAVLSFAALQLADHAMAQQDWDRSLHALEWVPAKDQLIRLQTQKVEEYRKALDLLGKQNNPDRTRIQQAYYTRTLQTLQAQLQSLEQSEDYTPAMLLRKGQCLLLAHRAREAWLIFEYLAETESYPNKIRQEAHYRWILSATELQSWEEALTIARSFMERYPDSELAPQALYLIAKAHQGQHRYAASNEVLSVLLGQYPQHRLASRWLFTRAFNCLFLEQYDEARSQFEAYQQTYPTGSLLPAARLWHGQSHFFERHYETAIEELQQVSEDHPNHPLYPEIRYRLGSAYYAARNYQEALSVINQYLKRFPGHIRNSEARVLKGDILMGAGELEFALDAFKQVLPRDPDSFLYATFQIGKILKALEDYRGMIAHYQAFLENEEAPRARLSEALYWMGWAYEQQNALAEAFPLYFKAIDQYGNDPDAGEIYAILESLQRWHERWMRDPGEDVPQVALNLLSHERFNDWLKEAADKAAESGQITWQARLKVFLAARVARKQPFVRESLLLEIAKLPKDQLDARALGESGYLLLQLGMPSSRELFEILLERFPTSHERGYAFYGMATLDKESMGPHAALPWLKRFKKETPMHPLLPEVSLLQGACMAEIKQYTAAREIYQELLRLKQARGKPHARAHMGIGDTYLAEGDLSSAIPYYQRVFNLYRAYTDLAAPAYLKSAEAFADLEDYRAAVSTLEEMLDEESIGSAPQRAQAGEWLKAWKPMVPPEPEPAPTATTETEGSP